MICWKGWGSKSNQKPSQIETVSVSSWDPTFKKEKKKKKGMSDSQRNTEALF